MPQAKAVRRINANLPEPLARYVASVTGKDGVYETPSEFVRDLIRREMEEEAMPYEANPAPGWEEAHRDEINAMLEQAMEENDYKPWTEEDKARIRRIARGEEKWPNPELYTAAPYLSENTVP